MSGAPGLRWIAFVSRLVPEARRDAWRREWEAEATYAWRRLHAAGRMPGRTARVRLGLRVMTCLFDAMTESMEQPKMTGLQNDLRFALRSLLRKPAFTTIAVVTLSLGIGATAAVFTLLDGVVLSPLPYDEPEQLVQLDHLGREGQDELPISAGLYVVYRDHAKSLASIAMHGPTVGNLVVNGEPERVMGRVVTPSFFAVLGVPAAQGRAFLDEEGRPGADPVIILSDALWTTRFGADPAIVGRTVDINGISREVVGVMPRDFGFPDRESRFWVPLLVNDAEAPLGAFFATGIARAEEGQTVESVRADVEALLARLTELAPGPGAAFLQRVNIRSSISSLKESLVGDLGSTLWILFATVGIVLVIACANVANLLLVRAETRQRELAIRVALGAGRVQVLRSFMGESLALSLAGAALGVAIAGGAVRLTTSLIPTDLPRMAEIGIDARVLAFTAAVALGCALFFGFFPLLRYGAKNLAGELREGGGARGATGGRERHRLRNGLVVSQVALALILLIGSGLMLRSFLALRAVDPGFDPSSSLTARVSVPTAEIPDWQAAEQFLTQLRERLLGQAGVTGVGFVSAVPLGGGGAPYTGIEVEDHPRADAELPVFASWPQAGDGYFEVMGIPVLEGRAFQAGDGADGFRAVVVSQAFAEKWWPGASPLGRRMRLGFQDEAWYQIVGVVGNVRQDQLEEVSQEMVYFPLVTGGGDQLNIARTVDVVIRTAGDPLTLVSVLRDQVRQLNPRIPIANPRALSAVFEGAAGRTSFTAAMLGAASGIALLLGLIGIYGVISYVVSQRTREIGVRMALGASGATVRGMVVRQGLAMSGAGVALGLIAAALLSRVLGSLLYGVGATDPLTYIAVALSLVGVAVLASLIPAIRAAGVDPGRALRVE